MSAEQISLVAWCNDVHQFMMSDHESEPFILRAFGAAGVETAG
jgi:hypothetical protein